jgi:hypothetical protein
MVLTCWSTTVGIAIAERGLLRSLSLDPATDGAQWALTTGGELFEDQYVELLPARLTMQTVIGSGGTGGNGGMGGDALAVANSGVVIVLNNSTIDTLTVINMGTGAVTADSTGGAGGEAGDGGAGNLGDQSALSPDHAALAPAASDQAVPDQAALAPAAPDHASPDHATPDQAAPDQAAPDQAALPPAGIDQAPPGDQAAATDQVAAPDQAAPLPAATPDQVTVADQAAPAPAATEQATPTVQAGYGLLGASGWHDCGRGRW